MEETKVVEKKQLLDLISRLPLFLPFSQNSCLELRETEEEKNYDCNHDHPSDYWDEKFIQHIRFIHLPTLIEWLRTEKVSEETLCKLQSKKFSSLKDLQESDRELLKEFM